MDYEERNENKVYGHFKASIDFAMGVFYIFIPIYAMTMKFIIEEYGKGTVFTISGLFIAYGIFRIIRSLLAFKKILTTKGRRD